MTDLTRKTSKVVDALNKGEELLLLYRSKPIGTIRPKKKPKVMTEAKLEELQKAIKALKPKKLIPQQKRSSVYLKRLKKEYGPRVS